MKIDIHTHIDSLDPEKIKIFIETCEQSETVVCMCSANPRGDHSSGDNNGTLKLSKEFPDTIIPFAFVDLWDKVDVGCVVHYVEQGFKGLKFITPYYEYDHDLYMPIYEQAEALKLPVLFHTGLYRPNLSDRLNRRPSLKNMHPLCLDRIARSFPELKIVMAHLGTSLFRREAAELVMLHPNLYADLAGNGAWEAVSAEELSQIFRPCVRFTDMEMSGFKKLVYGSDAYINYPQNIPLAQAGYHALLRKLGLPKELCNSIMGETVAEWLGIKS